MAGEINTCEVRVGRLLEIRVAAGYRTVADIDDMIKMIGGAVGKLRSDVNVVIAADWRAVRLMPPDTASRARQMLAGVSPRVTRSAILTLPENPTMNLQVVRLVREAELLERKHFSDVTAMRAWLGEVLKPDEGLRLAEFLA